MKYLNTRTSYGVETVDQLDPKDFPTTKDFRKELSRLIGEYAMCGMYCYSSSRCASNWK